ncbi:MAG: hypothetical protein RML35_00775 [Chloroherpetonaceae bacterium]|nr:hypothetical protein [Chloroherpetonaceae bacterium]
MRENLTFGISLDAQNFLSSLKKVYDSIRSLRVSIHDMANDFSNIFSDKRIQDAAKLKGEYLGLYGNLQSIGKNISDVFSDIGKATGVVVRETFVKLFKITSSLTKVGLEFTNAFLKLPFTILKLIDSFADLKGLISDAYKTFEDLVNQSIKLQQFFQGSKQFGDSLVKTAQTITKNIVGVNVEQVTGFLKQASAETKGFFNPKDVDATMIKSINSLAAALGTSFEDAAQKFTRFITGDSEMVRQLADELGRVGISLADIAAASQHAQAGLAGANQRAANLTALLSAKLKDANQIALQSVSGVQEVLGKNLAAIGTALIDPLYGKIRKVFMELLSLVQRNEKTIRYLLQTLASAIAPVFNLIIAGIHELEKLFQGLAKNFLSSSKEMSISLDLLGRPVQLLVNVFRSMYDAVIKVGICVDTTIFSSIL